MNFFSVNFFFVNLKEEKERVKPFFDLLAQTKIEYKYIHSLSMLLTSEIKNLGWSDIDTTKNANIQQLITKFGKVSRSGFLLTLSLNLKKKSNIQ